MRLRHSLFLACAFIVTCVSAQGQYSADISRIIQRLDDMTDLSDPMNGSPPGDAHVHNLLKDAAQLARVGAKKKSLQISDSNSYGDKSGRAGDGGADATAGRNPRGEYDKGWAGDNEGVEVVFIAESRFESLYDLFAQSGICEDYADEITDIAMAITVFHEMVHVNQSGPLFQGDDPQSNAFRELDAYRSEKKVLEWYRSNGFPDPEPYCLTLFFNAWLDATDYFLSYYFAKYTGS